MRARNRTVTRRHIMKAASGAFATGWSFPSIQDRKTLAAAQTAPVVDFREPSREYVAVKVGSYSFQVEKTLQTTGKATAKKAMDRLVKNADKALETLPQWAATGLRDLHYFVMHGAKARGGAKTNGLEYIQSNAPRYHHELAPRWGDSVASHVLCWL